MLVLLLELLDLCLFFKDLCLVFGLFEIFGVDLFVKVCDEHVLVEGMDVYGLGDGVPVERIVEFSSRLSSFLLYPLRSSFSRSSSFILDRSLLDWPSEGFRISLLVFIFRLVALEV